MTIDRSLAFLRRRLQWFTGVSCPLCLFALVITLTMAGVAFGAIVLDRMRAQQQSIIAAKGVADIARQRTADLMFRLDAALRAVEDAARPDPAAEGARARIDAAVTQRRRAEPRMLALYLLDPAGGVVAGSASTMMRSATVLAACLRDDRPDADQLMLRSFSAEQAGGGTLSGLCAIRGLRIDGAVMTVLAMVAGDLVQGQYADLNVGANSAVVLLDESARVLLRISPGLPASNEPRDRRVTDWEAALRGSGVDPATGAVTEMRRVDGPFGAMVAVVIPAEDVYAPWFARAELIGSSAFVVVMFIGLAVSAVKTCEGRERRRLERVAALAQGLGGGDPALLSRRLVDEACAQINLEVVPQQRGAAPAETLPGLAVPRADEVRIGGQTLRRRDGAPFTPADLTFLTALGRIGALQLAHADQMAATSLVSDELRAAADFHRSNSDSLLLEMPVATFMLDRDWRFVGTNRNADKLLGEYAEDIRGRVIWDVFPELEGTTFESECRRAVQERHAAEFELKWLRTEAWLMVHAHPRADGIVVYLQDIGRQGVFDEKLRQIAMMEAIGRLTGNIAHDFNNLLTVILGNSEMLDSELPETGEVREMHDQIKRAAQNAAALTHQLLAFARRQPLSPQEIDVGRLIVGLDGFLRSALGSSVQLEIRAAPSLWHARVDKQQLESAILNLAINARDALPPGRGGRLLIEAANLANRKSEVDQFGELKPGNYVVISVTDNGTGIARDIIGKVFEPFFTTKPAGRGTGLGLSMVYGFAQQSGGHARIVSDEGRGTTVRIYLPALGEARADGVAIAPPVARLASPVPSASGKTEKILIVEDAEMVRSHARSVLSGLGYDVTTAAEGAEALALLDKGLRPDLLLTDILLPNGMDGLAVAEQVLRRFPDLPVLYMSGYVENIDLQKSRLDPQTNLLLKPFRRASLAAMVRARLDSVRIRASA
jgi:PAS domain S-box-containing protein